MATIEGYGAVFFSHTDTEATEYEVSEGVFERIAPGAFDRAIKDPKIFAAFNHDTNFPLGRQSAKTLELRVDSKGLKYRIILPDSPNGANVATAVRRGDVNGSSFSFVPTKQSYQQVKRGGKPALLRILEEVELFELGPVVSPAYTGTTATMAAG